MTAPKNNSLMKNDSDYVTYSRIAGIFVSATAAVVATILLVTLWANVPIKDNWDVSNWATLVVEIGIGGAIATSILLYSNSQQRKFKKQQEQITTLLKETKNQQDETTSIIKEIKAIEYRQQKIINEQEVFKRRRHDFAINTIRSYLPELEHWIDELEENKKQFSTINQNDLDPILDKYEEILDSLNKCVSQIISQITNSIDVLDPQNVQEVKHLIQIIGDYKKIRYNLDSKPQAMSIKENIRLLLNSLPNPPI